MLAIKNVDHVGIRVRDKVRSITFYERLGFSVISDTGFEQGHPVLLQHPSGIFFNLLGPTSEVKDENILMDIGRKHSGYTHIALLVDSITDSEQFFIDEGIEVTGRFSYKGLNAIFVRDPDRNVIEFDERKEERI